MNQPKISEILRDAADNHLLAYAATPGNLPIRTSDKSAYSCVAAMICVEATVPAHLECDVWAETVQHLYDMGCARGSFSSFDEFPEGIERQSARHSWLYFAAMVLEEEGL